MVRRPLRCFVGEEGRPEDRQQQVLDDEAHRNRDDDHPEKPGASPNETEIHEAVEQHREDGAEQRTHNEADPDVHTGMVGEIGRKGAGGHDVPVGKIQDVGDAELQREPDRRDCKDRGGDKPEAKRRNQLLHVNTWETRIDRAAACSVVSL